MRTENSLYVMWHQIVPLESNLPLPRSMTNVKYSKFSICGYVSPLAAPSSRSVQSNLLKWICSIRLRKSNWNFWFIKRSTKLIKYGIYFPLRSFIQIPPLVRITRNCQEDIWLVISILSVDSVNLGLGCYIGNFPVPSTPLIPQLRI